MPFGQYTNMDDCVAQNKDKKSPGAYCATIHKKATGEWPGKKEERTIMDAILNLIYGWDNAGRINWADMSPDKLYDMAAQQVIGGIGMQNFTAKKEGFGSSIEGLVGRKLFRESKANAKGAVLSDVTDPMFKSKVIGMLANHVGEVTYKANGNRLEVKFTTMNPNKKMDILDELEDMCANKCDLMIEMLKDVDKKVDVMIAKDAEVHDAIDKKKEASGGKCFQCDAPLTPEQTMKIGPSYCDACKAKIAKNGNFAQPPVKKEAIEQHKCSQCGATYPDEGNCPKCGSAQHVDVAQEALPVCSTCQGDGNITDKKTGTQPCPDCGGSGVSKKEEETTQDQKLTKRFKNAEGFRELALKKIPEDVRKYAVGLVAKNLTDVKKLADAIVAHFGAPMTVEQATEYANAVVGRMEKLSPQERVIAAKLGFSEAWYVKEATVASNEGGPPADGGPGSGNYNHKGTDGSNVSKSPAKAGSHGNASGSYGGLKYLIVHNGGNQYSIGASTGHGGRSGEVINIDIRADSKDDAIARIKKMIDKDNAAVDKTRASG